MSQLFPREILAFSSEAHYHKFKVRGKPIYLSVISLTILFALILPLVKVDVSYAARGVLRTIDLPSQINTAREGTLLTNNIQCIKKSILEIPF